MSHGLGPTAHSDTFARDNLPPVESWPVFNLEKFQYPEYLNAGVELTDRMVEQGFGDNTALIGNGRQRTYKELSDWTNRIAHALAEDYGVKPGNRVLSRSANNPAMVACWLAATKAGAVVVNTMPMLRAGELGQIVDKAEIEFALCDTRLMDEIRCSDFRRPEPPETNGALCPLPVCVRTDCDAGWEHRSGISRCHITICFRFF